MQTIARCHVLFGLSMALAGMVFGIVMASTHDHGQHVAHAHALLLGLVVSLLYAMLYRLWVAEGDAGALAWAQLGLHQVGTLVLVGALYTLYGAHAPATAVEPVLAAASLAVLGSMALMLVVFVRATRATRPAGTRPGRARLAASASERA